MASSKLVQKSVCFLLFLQEVPEESIEEKRETESETEEKKGEEQTEEQKEDSEKVDEQQIPEEQEEKTEEPSLKPKHRRSFNLFKRRKTDKKAEKDEEKGEEKQDTGEETHESDKKEETPAEGTDSHEEVHLQNGKDDEEHEAKEDEKVDEESELDRKPKTRRSFNLRFRKRPKSVASADKETEDDGEETGLSRQDPVRHSYHAGDLTAREASKPRKQKFCARMFKFSIAGEQALHLGNIVKSRQAAPRHFSFLSRGSLLLPKQDDLLAG